MNTTRAFCSAPLARTRCPRSIWNQIPTRPHLSDSLGRRNTSGFTNLITDQKPPTGDDPPLYIKSLNHRTFSLSNSTVVAANLFVRESVGLLWNPSPSLLDSSQQVELEDTKKYLEITSQFKIFEILHPRPEMVIFGTGKSILSIQPSKILMIKKYLNSLGIQLDSVDTKSACSNYNLLIEEGRSVAGIFLTLEPVDSLNSQLLSLSRKN